MSAYALVYGGKALLDEQRSFTPWNSDRYRVPLLRNNMLLEMKRLLIAAIKDKDQPRRDIMRLVIADIEADHKRKNDDSWAELVIRKYVKTNNESLAFCKEGDHFYGTLTTQTEMLESLLPKTLALDEIEALFLNSDGNEIEQIQDADKDGQALGIAMKFLKAKDAKVTSEDVKACVSKWRS